MSNLVAHAERELRLIGEDEHVIQGLLKVVRAFADMGHSGSSAMLCFYYLENLLALKPLSALTNDPDEWIRVSSEIAGQEDLWQSARNLEAFSRDGGDTYYLLSECRNGEKKMHKSVRHISSTS